MHGDRGRFQQHEIDICKSRQPPPFVLPNPPSFLYSSMQLHPFSSVYDAVRSYILFLKTHKVRLLTVRREIPRIFLFSSKDVQKHSPKITTRKRGRQGAKTRITMEVGDAHQWHTSTLNLQPCNYPAIAMSLISPACRTPSVPERLFPRQRRVHAFSHTPLHPLSQEQNPSRRQASHRSLPPGLCLP